MALQGSGAIALSDIQDEYGGSNPIGLSEYYDKGNAPSSGAIDLAADFYGTSNTIPVNFLVVAGGGGGGQQAGGAGGYRSSHNSETSGGGCAAESALQLLPSTQYTVTVGAGSTGGNQGANSVISGSGITTITSLGGGGPATGGSGKGSHPGAGSAGTACQGYRGGSHVGYSNFRAGGGGGGASQVGGDAIALNHGSGRGGHGGSGQATSISGSSGSTVGTHRFAGGGGGCALNYPYPGRPPGNGADGGGDGKQGGTGHHATANTGSAGGGGNSCGNSGSGIVWLRVPSANYTGTTSGSPTVTTSGDYKVLKYTSSGTYTA